MISTSLGRNIDVIPLRAGLDPFGFFGKYQGIQIKGKRPAEVAKDIAQVLLKKPQHRDKTIQGMTKAFSSLSSETKIQLITTLDGWSILTDPQLKTVLEQASVSDHERRLLKNLVGRVGAFQVATPSIQPFDDDIPF